MALSDVTANGVERAIVEFDRLGREAFLSQFGFSQSRGYFLIRGGRRADNLNDTFTETRVSYQMPKGRDAGTGGRVVGRVSVTVPPFFRPIASQCWNREPPVH